MSKKLDYRICPVMGKRAWSERDADRALGRARRKRQHVADAQGTRRGLKIENRAYLCPSCDGHHTTAMSKRDQIELESRYAA